MLQRRAIIAFLVLLILTTTGCGLFRFIDNSSPDDMQKFATSKDELWDRARALENENAAYQKQVTDQQVEIDRMTRELTYWQNETTQADGRVAELSRTLDTLNAQLKQRPEVAQTTPPPQVEALPERKPTMIKILAGDGDIASARNLSKRLRKMGYPVKVIDKAPRSDFRGTTIFFAPGYQAAAAALVKKLGREAVDKPLTWQSIFNIIIVTGRSS